MSTVRAALRSIFGPTKSFEGIALGDARLQRLGLHPARIALADAAIAGRRGLLRASGGPGLDATFARDGIVVIPDFLPSGLFRSARDEAKRALAEVAEARGHPPAPDRGYQYHLRFDRGFDRYDGATLNRLLRIDARLPECLRAVSLESLVRWTESTTGHRHTTSRFHVYEMIHGDHASNPDPMRFLHKDSFHTTIKLWIFLDEATEADGPFVFVPGSHRVTAARYRWEYERAQRAIAGSELDRGGSFRVEPGDLEAMGLPEPRVHPVAPNTLVLADTRGFHRRGDAPAGARRLAIYSGSPRRPFSLSIR